MTLRERIADWISGGALTLARYERDRNKAAADRALDKWDNALDRYTALMAHRFALQRALRAIIECDRPPSTPKEHRMIAIARDALN